MWHDALIHNLIIFGFDHNLIKIIRSYLQNRTFKVHVCNQYSNACHIPAGCPQGSCLSPILDNIFMSDFPTLESCEYSIFADDTALLCSGISWNEILLNLQMVNPIKTQTILFSNLLGLLRLNIWELYLTKK